MIPPGREAAARDSDPRAAATGWKDGEEGSAWPAADAPRFRWIAAALLGGVGFLLNLLPVALSPGTDLVFGGAAYLLAAATLGPAQGLLAAAIASVRTIWLWNHPYAWLIFCAEALVVGLVVARGRRRPVLADLLFWAVIGVPLVLLFYRLVLHVPRPALDVILLKQPLNGLVDALLVELLLLFPLVRRTLRIPDAPRLQAALSVVVAMAAVLPALAFGVWVGQREWTRSLNRAHDRVQLFSQAYASKLEQYVLLHERAVRSVVEAAQRRGEFSPEQLGRLVAGEHEQFPGFVDMYAADSRAITVAFHPLRNARGESLIGLDFSDRTYFQQLRDTRRTVISEVFAGRGGVDEPLVIIAHPIVLADTFAGYVLGALDLKALPRPEPAPAPSERLRVADARGTLIFDSKANYRSGEKPRTLADSVAFAAITATEGAGTTTYTARAAMAAPAVTAATMLAGVSRLPVLGWWVWVEQPFSLIQNYVAESYVWLFSLLIGVTILTLLASILLSRYLARPLLRLRTVSGALAAGNLQARVGSFASAVPQEVAEVGRGFDEMADALAGHTTELEELGEIARSLASTLDLQELLRRITDAAVRLVSPDGCAIALINPQGEGLRTADYSVGLLSGNAGHHIPLDSSVVGWVARTQDSVLISDLSTDPRVFREYLDAEEVRSVICAPLVGRSGALGALIAVRARSSPSPFDSSDLRLLERLADNAAVAVENARLLEAAEAANRAKSDFIATMSHELRTPLNAMLGHLELVEMEVHGPINERQRDALQRIRTATRHLRGLIEEVLSFAQLEAGRAEVRLAPTDLCALAREVTTVVEPLARQKGLEFHTHCVPEEAVIESDADKIRQILINLAGNAVKFTEQGEVVIRVEAENGTVRVSVSDTGIGISREDQERLFQPFEQLESGLARSHGGTGLGLYLSGQYARLIGGQIEVESEQGCGSTFSLLLPRTTQQEQERGAGVGGEGKDGG